jgi:hypothetical protein
LRNITLWECREERRVAPRKKKEMRKMECGIMLSVVFAIFASEMTSGEDRSVGGELAIEDNHRSLMTFGLYPRPNLRALAHVVVDCFFDVTCLKFIFETAVEDNDLIKGGLLLSLDDAEQGLAGNEGENCVWFARDGNRDYRQKIALFIS